MKAADFKAFFSELHSPHEEKVWPFPWQERLAKRVAEQGWTAVLDLPTSAGKTAAMDIALFHLALEVDKPPSKRQAPRRIFFIVDRRLVVDEAYERACRIRDRLSSALTVGHGILAEVARRLVTLSAEDGAEPLEVIRLRGGLPRERAFIRNPLQPAIIVTTVDQVGSRLLFRGYGVREFMRPIHAGLVGIDSLLILDEAHLSRPFVETLQWVRRYQSEAWAEHVVGKPSTVVQMTATPPPGEAEVFSLSNADWGHPILGPRLTRTKQAELLKLTGDKDSPEVTRRLLLESLVGKARSLMTTTLETSTAPVVGVVVNRVSTAREVFERLRNEDGSDALLLTGRIRPFERDELLKEYFPRMKAGRTAGANPKPLYVVATQTVEVGADLDFDALLTEAAALDALRQRFGRLNRLGLREQSPSVIVYMDLGKAGEPDPVYGDALTETWKWMEKVAVKSKGKKPKEYMNVMDFGIERMRAVLPAGEDLVKLLTPSAPAPVLMPAHVDLLAQTSPPPMVEPEIALYLHGKETQPEDVQVIWRADLQEPLGPDDEEDVVATVAALPPDSLEALSIPVWSVRAWLRGNWPEEIADVEGRSEQEEPARKGQQPRYALCWRGPEHSRLVSPDEVQSGDTLVVPASYGGHDRFGWCPSSQSPVKDVADHANWLRRGKHALRIHRNLIPQWFESESTSDDVSTVVTMVDDLLARYTDGEDLSALCDELIGQLLRLPGLKANIRDVLFTLQESRREIVYPTAENPQGILLRSRQFIEKEFTDEDDAASLTREVGLDSHCKGVGELARTFATHIGLPDGLAEDVFLAGKLHDLGKADPRFQAWLWGGDRMAAKRSGTLLAKSGVMDPNDHVARRVARERAGFPAGARHECYSVSIVSSHNHLLDKSHDRDLVLYLIGTHHGRGRPLMPAIEDDGIESLKFEFDGLHLEFNGTHQLERLDSGWSERFWRLIRRYGYWGLAYLETIVRLADHRRSELGQ
ncbi:MAG: type I-U CRISPR-associated helicase/endonuclease Cas3 [Nitrospirota bacterium]